MSLATLFPGSTRAEQFPSPGEDQPLFMSPSEGGTVGISIFAPSWGGRRSWGAASARFLKGAGDPHWKPGCSPDRKGPLPVKAELRLRPGAPRPPPRAEERNGRGVGVCEPAPEARSSSGHKHSQRDRRTFTGPTGASRRLKVGSLGNA